MINDYVKYKLRKKNIPVCKLNQIFKPRITEEAKVYNRISKTSEMIKRKA